MFSFNKVRFSPKLISNFVICKRFESSVNLKPNEWLKKYIVTKIKATGPITVSEYMKEVLTNPRAGYYVVRDSIGVKGDFITSPEISQMFGELVAVWFINEWNKVGKPKPFQIIELGPGKGTLMDDMLRIFKRIPEFEENFSAHLVEVSSKLIQEQQTKLGYNSDLSLSKYKVPIHWHSSLNLVPKAFSFIIAHEFFDALPIHKFQKQNGEWFEVLIDIDDTHNLRYVLSKTANTLFIKKEETRNHIEVSLESGIILQNLASLITEKGGFALIMDYGHNGTKEDTFRAFRDHAIADPLVEPGVSDLTADVDFRYFAESLKDHALTYGPITQQEFLQNMGINLRLRQLLMNATPEVQKNLVSGFQSLVDPDKMGERFKVMAVYPQVITNFLKKFPPAGFVKLE